MVASELLQGGISDAVSFFHLVTNSPAVLPVSSRGASRRLTAMFRRKLTRAVQRGASLYSSRSLTESEMFQQKKTIISFRQAITS